MKKVQRHQFVAAKQVDVAVAAEAERGLQVRWIYFPLPRRWFYPPIIAPHIDSLPS
jgi:hypothetical protein